MSRHILKTRKSQLVLFLALSFIMGATIIWDFINNSKVDDAAVEPRLNTVGSSLVSVDWVDPLEVEVRDKSIVKKAFDGYQKMRPEMLSITETAEQLIPSKKNTDSLTEALGPLIKFELTDADPKPMVVTENPVLDLPIGTMVYARLLRPVDSTYTREDQPVYAELMRPLVLNAHEILPAKTKLLGELKAMRRGFASFERNWRVIIDGEDHHILQGQLQEREYDPVSTLYGQYDGMTGLRMKQVAIDMEPRVHKLERLFEEVVRPLAVRKSQIEILEELDLPTIDDPWDIDGFESNEGEDGEAYYLPAGTEFYIQTFGSLLDR